MTKRAGVFWFTPKGVAAIGLIGAASYFLLIEHRQHIFNFLPFLIILACPLMHIFMHGGHGGHGRHGDHQNEGGQANKEQLPDKTSLDDAYQRGLEDGKKKSTEQRQDH